MRSFCSVPTEDNPDYAGPEGNKLRDEAQKFAEARHALMTKASEAFEAGDKAKAKELSEQGKEAGKKMEDANARAAEVILQHRNGEYPENYLDLHGLYLEEALTAFRDRLSQLQATNTDDSDEIVFEVIPGAGNHSKNKAIIKPKIIEELQGLNLYFEEKNAGSLLVYVSSDAQSASASSSCTATSTLSTDKEEVEPKAEEESNSHGDHKDNKQGSDGSENAESGGGYGFGTFATIILLGSMGSVAAYAALEPNAEKDAHNLIKRIEDFVK